MNDTVIKPDTLLIIDDTPDNITVLLTFLTEIGFKVLVTSNGEQGIKTAAYAQPDLILLDVMMPGIDGFEVCRLLKTQETTQTIPIIFMTALADTINKVRGFELGAADYITKPFQYEEVSARINTHLNVHKLQKQLQAQNQLLQEEIHIRKVTEQSLEKRNMELDAFAHMVAHDLKNPLSSIIGFANLLKNNSYFKSLPADDKHMESLYWIIQSSRKMVGIIDALLLLAGVSKRAVVEINPLNMNQILQQILQQRLGLMIREYAGEVQLPNSWPTALGYAPWVEEIWVNYLSNGLKYGGKPPRLELGADIVDNGKLIKFWVKDNGQGIDMEVQAKLFTPFTRLHVRHAEGHGLGLSIVQQIAEKLGGQVGVESAPNRGSLFYFTLPVASVH